MSVITLNDAQAETAGAALDLYDNATLLVYALNPQYEKEFKKFYKDVVVDWLKARGMKEGKGWIINHQLIYTSTPNPPTPWSMAGLEKYLSQEYPPVPEELPYTDDSSETYPTAQAS